MTLPNEDRAALMGAAQQIGTVATVLTQAGILMGNALLACPYDGGTQDELRDFLRQWVAFTPEDQSDPTRPIATAYIARAIAGESVLETKPGPEEVIAIIERWIAGAPALGLTRSFKDMRDILGTAIGLTGRDIDGFTNALKRVQKQVEDA